MANGQLLFQALGNDEDICHKIIANAKLDGWKIGKSQVTNNDIIISQITLCICSYY